MWDYLDFQRTNVLPGLFDDRYGWEDYAIDVLSTPLMFADLTHTPEAVASGASPKELHRPSFRENAGEVYPDRELNPYEINHIISTHFNDVRLKNFIELRHWDSLPIERAERLTEIVSSLFYVPEHRERLESYFEGISEEEVFEAKANIQAHGREASPYGQPLDFWKEFLGLEGLLSDIPRRSEAPRRVPGVSEEAHTEKTIARYRCRRHDRMFCFGTVLHIRPRILDVVAHGSGENADRLADMTAGNSLQHKRVRKSPGERRQEILDAAVRLISERGYNGTSVQDVADAVGVTKQGVLRYFPSKDNLLAAVYHENYNTFGSVEDFMASGLPGSGPDDFRLPAYLRFLVHCNSTRPMLVQLFSILQVESFNPAHPLHDEFANRRDSIWQYYSTYNWNLPSEFTSFEEVRPTLRHALEIMDGVQLRWLRGPAIDLCDEWADLEPAIFPSPIWDGYR